MSDEDWENQLESDDEEETKKAEEKKKQEADKWNESKEDPEKIRLAKEAEKKKAEEARQAEARVKNKNAMFDPDAAFKKRQEQYGGSTADVKADDLKGLSAAAKGVKLEQNAEKGMIDQLFMGEDEAESLPAVVKLNDQKDYVKYGEQTAKILYNGAAPYRIENFYKSLCKDLQDHCDAQQIKKILDDVTKIHKEKEKAERAARGTGGKKGNAGVAEKAVLKGGGGKGYDRNNNAGMIQDQMGGDDYGDYGDESGAGFKREGEVETDFM